MSEVNLFQNWTQTSQELDPIVELINQIMALSEDGLNDQNVEIIRGMLEGAITPNIKENVINETLALFSSQNYTRSYVETLIKSGRIALADYIDELQPSEHKRTLLKVISNFMNDVFDAINERYNSHDFVLPIKLEENAHILTYAHNTDAAADIYALEDMTLAPHSLSNMVHTGLRIALPEGWAAYILPRSSIGMKTGLRLSNSVGVIDSEYRGEIGVMYDNHSDSEYVIHKGDRIAQMIVMPVHQFKPEVVDTLDNTSRGEGGFGSTGK